MELSGQLEGVQATCERGEQEVAGLRGELRAERSRGEVLETKKKQVRLVLPLTYHIPHDACFTSHTQNHTPTPLYLIIPHTRPIFQYLIPHAPHLTPHTPYFSPHPIPQPTPHTSYPSPYTILHTLPHTPHFIPHLIPHTSHSTPYTHNPPPLPHTLRTPHPTPHT